MYMYMYMNVALYELGNTLQMGTPVENAMASAADAVKSGAVHDMFTKASENITTYKMTLREAFFNKETGAMKNYPSKLVTTIVISVPVGLFTTQTEKLAIVIAIKIPTVIITPFFDFIKNQCF